MSSTGRLSARLAMPAMIVGAFGFLRFRAGRSRLLAGEAALGSAPARLDHADDDPARSRLVTAGLSLGARAKPCRSRCLAPRIAAVFALPVSLLAARNIVPSNLLRFPVRRFLDSIRGVDTLIWALVWINVVGLGPFAGVLAIAVSDFGAFGKLFSEAIEAADRKQVEGIRASGGNALHEIRFGLMPQVLPVIAGQVLYFIESNTRSATIIGIVGAGGIGLQLAEQIRVLEWQKVSFLILMILVAVAAIDWISSQAALCHHRTARGGLSAANYSPPRTRRARRQSASVLSPAVCRRYRRRCCRPRGPDVPARGRAARRRWRRRWPR